MLMSQQGRRICEQMGQHVRCAYFSPITKDRYEVHKISDTGAIESAEVVDYFKADSYDQKGQILHLVTTNANIRGLPVVDGLFEVTYRFDRNTGELMVSRKQFTSSTDISDINPEWQKLADNISDISLLFFDGRQWLSQWDSKQIQELPFALKIEIELKDQSNRHYQHSTVAQVYCSRSSKKNQLKTNGV
jgi:hypothetical protein